MHNSQTLSIKRLIGFMTVLFLSISIILPPMAAAYGDGGSGSKSESDKPANNRAFDDTPPNAPNRTHTHPPFPHKPFVIQKNSAYLEYGPSVLSVLQTIDFLGMPAGAVLFFIAGPEYVFYHTIKYGILATRAGSFAINKPKQRKWWGYLKSGYKTVKDGVTGAYTRVKEGMQSSSNKPDSPGYSTPVSK